MIKFLSSALSAMWKCPVAFLRMAVLIFGSALSVVFEGFSVLDD